MDPSPLGYLRHVLSPGPFRSMFKTDTSRSTSPSSSPVVRASPALESAPITITPPAPTPAPAPTLTTRSKPIPIPCALSLSSSSYTVTTTTTIWDDNSSEGETEWESEDSEEDKESSKPFHLITAPDRDCCSPFDFSLTRPCHLPKRHQHPGHIMTNITSLIETGDDEDRDGDGASEGDSAPPSVWGTPVVHQWLAVQQVGRVLMSSGHDMFESGDDTDTIHTTDDDSSAASESDVMFELDVMDDNDNDNQDM